MLLVKNCNVFHYLISLKLRLEIRFNNILDRKETFFDYKKTFGQKMEFFSLFVFSQKKNRNKV